MSRIVQLRELAEELGRAKQDFKELGKNWPGKLNICSEEKENVYQERKNTARLVQDNGELVERGGRRKRFWRFGLAGAVASSVTPVKKSNSRSSCLLATKYSLQPAHQIPAKY